jgi:hypothetical protein
MLSAKDAFSHLKYAPGIGIEIAIAYWLLSQGGPAFGASALMAYALIAASALTLLVGFFWYLAWFAERGAAGRYLLGVSFFVGVVLWSTGQYLWSLEPLARPCYERPCPGTSSLIQSLFLFGGCLVGLPVVYGSWRLIRLVVVRAFRVLLVAVSQIGAAWRGASRP